MKSNFLIYGAYGYTGELISRLAVSKGHKPILAGRDAVKTKALADELGLVYRVFEIAEEQKLYQALTEVAVVLHCAGPFELTTPQMLKACLATQTHYLDITGEIDVFEYVAAHHQEIQKAGISAIPGVGFDVVPSDCLAKFLYQQLPDATELNLAFKTVSELSRGTALTVVRGLGNKGKVRKDGKIIDVPSAYHVKTIYFNGQSTTATTIPWGDVSTAFYSTGIPNIRVYSNTMPPWILNTMNYIAWLLGMGWVQSLLQKYIKAKIHGPSEMIRTTAKSYFWGEVRNKKGQSIQAHLTTLEGYQLTSITALLATEKVLNGKIKTGFQTPSNAFGADFILEVADTTRGIG